MTADAIVRNFKNYMCERSLTYDAFYVGITSEPATRLRAHNATQYTHAQADDIDQARLAEAALLAAGCRGGAGGGDDDSTTVYVYQITRNTVE